MRLDAGVLALAVAMALGACPVFAGDRALLIGVNDYLDTDISDLPGTAIDVQNMRRLLIEEFSFPEDGIKVLTETDATRAGILGAIENWLIDGTGTGDRIYLYFSGHGAQVIIPDGNGGTRPTSGLVPQDTDTEVEQSAARAGGLILGSQLGELIGRMAGREVTIVVDACHSGSLTRGADGFDVPANVRTITPNGPAELDPDDLSQAIIAEARAGLRLLDFNTKDGTPLPGVAVWHAADLHQYSYDSPSGGIFTRLFVEGLRERRAAFSGDGRVSASSLLAYVQEGAEEFCPTHPLCQPLGFTPELLAPDAYRAAILVPYASGGGSLLDDAAEEPDPDTTPGPENDPGADAVPPLVDLAEGLFAHENDFAIEAAILPGPRVRLGDAVRFSIRSEETGRIVVLDSGPDGTLRRIFPNAYSMAAEREGIVVAGHALSIPDESYPFEFTATDPGPGTLVVLVTEPDADLEALFNSPDFEAVDNVERALVAVAAELQTPMIDPDPEIPNRVRKWAFVTVPYLVSP